MKTFFALVSGVLLAGCVGGGNVGEDSQAIGDAGGIKGLSFSAITTAPTSAGEFSSIAFDEYGGFVGRLGGNTVVGEAGENPAGHVTIKFDGIGGSPCARLNAASVVVHGWASGGGLTLDDACNAGTTYALSPQNR